MMNASRARVTPNLTLILAIAGNSFIGANGALPRWLSTLSPGRGRGQGEGAAQAHAAFGAIQNLIGYLGAPPSPQPSPSQKRERERESAVRA